MEYSILIAIIVSLVIYISYLKGKNIGIKGFGKYIVEVKDKVEEMESKDKIATVKTIYDIEKVSVGKTFNVPKWTWVDIDLYGDETDFRGIDYGGIVKVIKYYDENSVVCQYKSSHGRSGGTNCLQGAQFLLPIAELSTFNARTIERKLKKELHLEKLNN